MRRLAVVLVVAACGDNAAPHFARAFQRAECEYYVRCGLAGDVDDCLAFERATVPPDDSVRAAIEDGTIAFDPAAADRCLDAYRVIPCDHTQEEPGSFAACGEVFTGQRDDGEACAFALECTSGRCDKPDCTSACCRGTCKPARVLPGEGEPCTSACVDADYCGADDRCHPYGQATEPCDDVHPCGYALYCAGRAPNVAGTCAPYPHLGEACETQCAEVGAACRSGACMPVLLEGEPCAADGDCSMFYVCRDGACGVYAPAMTANAPLCY